MYEMNEEKNFYVFRGNIEFKDLNLFNYNIENTKENKNRIFNSFFEKLEECEVLKSKYRKRQYLMIFCRRYDDLVHFQLARRKEYMKYDFVDNSIVGILDDSYPNVNVFVDLKGQKFMIESNSDTFENYDTCRTVIKNIMDNVLSKRGIYIALEEIVEESSFWQYFDNDFNVYSIEFKLNAPNLLGSADAAGILMKDSNENLNANKVTIKFENKNGKIKPSTKRGIESFVKYACDGGGDWKLKYREKSGKRLSCSNSRKGIKLNISLPRNIDSKELPKSLIAEIISKFSEVERIGKLK